MEVLFYFFYYFLFYFIVLMRYLYPEKKNSLCYKERITKSKYQNENPNDTLNEHL